LDLVWDQELDQGLALELGQGLDLGWGQGLALVWDLEWVLG